MTSCESSSSFYQADDSVVRLRLVNKKEAKASGSLLFVIDKSGSMSGEWKQVQTAVSYMNENQSEVPEFILYDGTARFADIFTVLQSSPSGSTNFSAAFTKIQEYINTKSAKSHINIIFMTDGHNNGGDVNQGIKLLSAYLKSCRRTSCIHTIGFSTSHDRKLLDAIRVLGTSEGDYRFAERKDLDEKFSELFDFVSTSAKVTVTIGSNTPRIVDVTKTEEGQILDLLLTRLEIDPEGTLFAGKECTIMVDSTPYQLCHMEADFFFLLRKVEEMEIISQEDLNKAQKKLKGINPAKIGKEKRREALELKMIVQEKLDKFHALFAEIARGLVSGDNISAQLHSLRHDSKFGKARRTRAMDQRISKNIDSFLDIEDQLEALPKPDITLFKEMDLSCALSSASIEEIMTDSVRDLMVFPLRIARPEQAIDAPTQIIIEKFLIGHYSFEAFKDAVQYAITNVGSQKALGGFTAFKNDEAVGLFKGSDGELTNACLPLYIHEDHWKRVEIQIEPILGYFFTMDPLGYKGDQILALFMILGNMLCSKANGTFCNEPALWLINDFTKTCTALFPKISKYLGEGRYSGRVRNDIVEEFVSSPVNRSKEALSNLLVLVGWEHCKQIRCVDKERFDVAFVEETWRRSFGALFKGQPTNQAGEWIEALIFGPSKDSLVVRKTDDGNTVCGNDIKNESKVFGEWAKAKLGLLSKNKNVELLKKYPRGPEFGAPEEEYAPRNIIVYEDHKEYLDSLVSFILERIQGRIEFLSHLYDGAVTAASLPGKTKWMMLIQALQYSSNSKMNQALANGNYKNTFDYVCSGNPDKTVADYLQPLFDKYELNRKNDWNTLLMKKKAFLEAKKCALMPDLYSFAGRILRDCPTRGGDIFSNLVALLSAKIVDGKSIPLLYEKICVIMIGTIVFVKDGDPVSILGQGLSWVQCPENTAMQLRDALNPEEWISIENRMYGVWGWAYRVSDIPNRHGHCNSNPYAKLTQKFDGFHLPQTTLKM